MTSVLCHFAGSLSIKHFQYLESGLYSAQANTVGSRIKTTKLHCEMIKWIIFACFYQQLQHISTLWTVYKKKMTISKKSLTLIFFLLFQKRRFSIESEIDFEWKCLYSLIFKFMGTFLQSRRLSCRSPTKVNKLQKNSLKFLCGTDQRH